MGRRNAPAPMSPDSPRFAYAALDAQGTPHHASPLRTSLHRLAPIAIAPPAGTRVEKVYVNGVLVAPVLADGMGRCSTTAAEAGHELPERAPARHHRGPGRLLTLRGTSLRASRNQLAGEPAHVDLRLPSVFDYTWTGGSLSPTELGRKSSTPKSCRRPGSAWCSTRSHRIVAAGGDGLVHGGSRGSSSA